MSIRALTLLAFAAIPLVPARADSPGPQGPAPTPAPAKAPAITLVAGETAPALTIDTWVKGTPVPKFEAGKVYLVEFWATWCGPCVASMPHLSELQAKYRDQGLTVIGVTSLDSRGNTLDAVKEMVQSKGDGMGYTVAWDKDRTTNTAWMRAAGRNTIPSAFLVDQSGRIAYVGSPRGIDAILEQVMAKKHDIEALGRAARRALAESEMARTIAPEIQAKAAPIQKEYAAAREAKDWPKAIDALDRIVALAPDAYWGNVAARYQIVAIEMKDPARAKKDALAHFAGAGASTWRAMNAIAWFQVDPKKPLEGADTAFALDLAQRARTLTRSEEPFVLDTLARVHFVRGDRTAAIETQKLAVALEPTLGSALREYEAVAK